MSHTRTIQKIYNTAFDRAVELQFRRDAEDADNYEEIKLSDEEAKHLSVLERILDLCQESPFMFIPPTDEFGNIEFDFVTPTWIKKNLDDLGISQNELAAGVNVNATQISMWLNGTRNPSGAAQAAIYYFIRSRIES